MKINHNNKQYVLDVDRAISLGVLEEEIPPVPFAVGGVYKKGSRNNLLLVEVKYKKSYQLLGMGAHCNSNEFYNKIHTKKEILEYLKGSSLIKNISNDIARLVGSD